MKNSKKFKGVYIRILKKIFWSIIFASIFFMFYYIGNLSQYGFWKALFAVILLGMIALAAVSGIVLIEENYSEDKNETYELESKLVSREIELQKVVVENNELKRKLFNIEEKLKNNDSDKLVEALKKKYEELKGATK